MRFDFIPVAVGADQAALNRVRVRSRAAKSARRGEYCTPNDGSQRGSTNKWRHIKEHTIDDHRKVCPQRCSKSSLSPAADAIIERSRAVQALDHRSHVVSTPESQQQSSNHTTPADDCAVLSFSSAAANRQQLKMLFLDHRQPDAKPLPSSLKLKYAQWLEPRGVAMSISIDCLILLGYARVFDHEPSRRQAQRLYLVAVSQLRRELSDRKPAQIEALMATIEIMAACSRYRDLGLTQDLYNQHLNGLHALIQVTSVGDLHSPFSTDIIVNQLPTGLLRAIRARRRFQFDTFEWQAALGPVCKSPFARLILLACSLPATLEKLARLQRKDRPATTDLDDCRYELHTLKDTLQHWLVESQSAGSCDFTLWRTSMEFTFPELARGPAVRYPFTYAACHKTIMGALTLVAYWVLLLEIHEALLALAGLSATEPNPWEIQQLSEPHRQCTHIAEHIGRTIPYIHLNSADQRILAVLYSTLLFLKGCYKELGMEDGFAWVDGVLQWMKQQDSNATFFKRNVPIENMFCGWLMFVPRT